MKRLPETGLILRGIALGLAVLATCTVAKANPYASCVTNTAGNISFYLNESGGNITITYEDGTTNANFNGVTTGTNVVAGVQSFALGAHTSYSISVFKVGTGSPSVITNRGIGTTRGVAINPHPTSPYFGHVYDVQGGSGVWLMNSDLSLIAATAQKAGVTTWNNSGTGTGQSPDWVSIAPDDFALVTDTSTGGSSIYRIAPDFSTNQLLLGPVGESNGVADGSHTVLIGPALVTGSIGSGNMVLYSVDADLGTDNELQIWNIGAGPLPWTNAPSYPGIQIALPGFTAETLGGNEYPGLTMGPPPNNYIYGSTYRSAASFPFVSIADSTGTNLIWNSQTNNPPTGDWFLQLSPPGVTTLGVNTGLAGTSAVSPDGKYIVGVDIENYFVVCPLTNGIPDTSKLFVVPPTSYVGNGRGVAWDAAENIYLSSSGEGLVQEWTLGGTSTAITTGNASGTTGFSLVVPANQVTMSTDISQASQGGVNGTPGTPVSGQFSINRFNTNGDYSLPLGVSFSLTGTATNGVYTVTTTGTGASITPGSVNNSVFIPAGQTNITVTITPTTNNVPRLTNTVILTILPGGSYAAPSPNSGTVFIQNTSSQQLQIVAGGAPSMYKAFPNDFASVLVERLGDVTVSSYAVSNFTYSGTAVKNVEYVPASPITFNSGDFTNLVTISPLDPTTNYVGNKTIVVALAPDPTVPYTVQGASATLTIIDNADPPTTVLWSTPLTNPNESNSWAITYGSANMLNVDTNDYEVTFGYNLLDPNNISALSGGIALPPNGASNVLRITCNKEQLSPGASAGVNAYPTNMNFSGNYAVRFNMNMIQGSNPGRATEGPIFGINHGSRGLGTNWWVGDGIVSTLPGIPNWTADGIWYWIDGAPGGAGAGDYIEFTSVSNKFPNTGWQMLSTKVASAFTNVFKSPNPFNTTGSGIPGNQTANLTGTNAYTWADVEIKQINGVVTLSIDKTPVFTYNNTTIWTNGFPMLGFNDPFASVQNEDGAAYYSNLRVVQVGRPMITQILLAPQSGFTNVVINFTTTDGDDTASSFTLLAATNLVSSPTGVLTNLTKAVTGTNTFVQLGTGAFQVTTKLTNSTSFYRILHN